MWNNLDLKNPVNDIVKYNAEDRPQIENLRDFATVLITAADLLTSDDPLWKEMQVFKNIQAKYKRILHCDKCLVYLHRVSHCLKKMVLLNLSKNYLDLSERFIIGDPSEQLHLPSRQQVEFILMRSQAAAKLICEAIKYTKETFCFLLQKLKIGHLIVDLVMAASVAARLHVLLKGILVKLCMTYQNVLSWLYKVKNGTHKWPEKVDLPLDLEKWLSEFESDVLKPFPMSEDDTAILKKFLKARDRVGEDSDADSVTVIEPQDEGVDCMIIEETAEDIDCGEVIPRTEVNRESKFLEDQKLTLEKVIAVSSFKKLEKIWLDICSSKKDILPITLTTKKKKIIGKFLGRVKEKLGELNTELKKKNFVKNAAIFMLAQYLGFTQEQIDLCKNSRKTSSDVQRKKVQLQPVTRLEELTPLYENLYKILKSKNKPNKCKKLKKIFRQRLRDIELLQQSGKEKKTVKKLVFCTSEVLLTLFKK